MSEWKGLDELKAKLEAMEQQSEEMTKRAARLAIKEVQARAKYLCPANEGELRNSIRTSVSADGNAMTARCFTNKSYAAYVEFGTGPMGAKRHEGISPDVSPVYVQHGWAFPASAITSGPYHFAEREYNGETYYLTNGQAAQPFMYPALKDGETQAIEKMQASIKRTMGAIAKK